MNDVACGILHDNMSPDQTDTGGLSYLRDRRRGRCVYIRRHRKTDEITQ